MCINVFLCIDNVQLLSEMGTELPKTHDSSGDSDSNSDSEVCIYIIYYEQLRYCSFIIKFIVKVLKVLCMFYGLSILPN